MSRKPPYLPKAMALNFEGDVIWCQDVQSAIREAQARAGANPGVTYWAMALGEVVGSARMEPPVAEFEPAVPTSGGGDLLR